MKISLLTFVIFLSLSLNMVLGSSYYDGESYSMSNTGNNVLVTKFVVGSEHNFDSEAAILDIYQERAIDNPIYLKYNTLESLKLGYRDHVQNPGPKKVCMSVRSFRGPSYQGYKAVVYRTDCSYESVRRSVRT